VGENIYNLVGKTTLKDVASILLESDLLISVDTGIMHLGAALGIPTIALFGPTAPWRCGPYGQKHIVIQKEVGCNPCYKKKCKSKLCMKSITVDDVWEAVRKKLKEKDYKITFFIYFKI